MTAAAAAFVGSCTAVGRLLSTQQDVRCLPCRPYSHLRHLAHPAQDAIPSQKRPRPPIALEKRRKEYFFKLLSAARNRDKRLFVSVVKSLGKDKDHMRSVDSSDPLHIQDVLLKAASRCGQVALADRLFKAMLAKAQPPTQRTAGAFLDALKLDGQADRCVAVFSQMAVNGVDLGDVCFNIVISALVQDGKFTTAMDMLERASAEWGIDPDAYTFNIFFNAAAKRNTDRSRAAVMKARELMIQWGVAPDRVTINAQVNHAIKEGRLDEAIDMFEKALDGGFRGVVPDVITFNVGISAYMARNLDNRAFELLDEMGRRGIRPRADTFNSILTGLTKMGDTLRVIEVFNKYLRQDDVGHGSSVAPSLVTYNLVLQALCLENDVGQAHLVEAEMRRRNVNPDNITFAALVRLQRSQDDVYDKIETARRLRIRPSLTFLNSCIRALGDHNDVWGACRIMDRMKTLENVKPDAISYNSLIYALVQDPWVSEQMHDAEGVTGSAEVTAAVKTASSPSNEGASPMSCKQDERGSTARFDGLTGAEAALLLLEEMKMVADSTASPDIFTYTTVISGVVRAEAARRSAGHEKTQWRGLGSTRGSEADPAEDRADFVSSTTMCQQLYVEAVGRGVDINGKICNAVMLGFGSDLSGAIKFWRQHIRPALTQASGLITVGEASMQQPSTSTLSKRKKDLFSAYCGLLHVCGRARRPDAAIKVVYALRKDGIAPSSTLSNTYFKAKQDGKDLDDDPRSGRTTFGVMRLLHGQMEDTLEVECGISKHSDPVDLPVERIRIRF